MYKRQENRRGCLFDTVGTTQRPDVLCAKLLEGRVGLLIDGTPFALVIPKLFCESFQTMDDYCYRPAYATLIRWIKYAAFLVAVLLPALYVAIALHHPEPVSYTHLSAMVRILLRLTESCGEMVCCNKISVWFCCIGQPPEWIYGRTAVLFSVCRFLKKRCKMDCFFSGDVL